MDYRRMIYPFTAIVGQEKMKLALLLNALNPAIGGVLIRGHRGTAKSTAARSLAKLLPEIAVVKGCPFNCDPDDAEHLCPQCNERKRQGALLERFRRKMSVVTLPLGSSEDRVLGTIDIEKAIRKGEKQFEPGVLARANRGVLYVDEVNLLDDHIVDILLDAAAMGVNTVEREGISFSHPSRFILIGTMNPEEGELRPQLLDRFGLCVDIEGENDIAVRSEIIRNRMEYEKDAESFIMRFEKAEQELREHIVKAQGILPVVSCPESAVRLAAQICLDMNADGHRADIVLVKAASSLAAYKLKNLVAPDDVYEAAELVLPHRMHKRENRRSGGRREEFQKRLDEHKGGKREEKKKGDEDHEKKKIL